MPLESVVGREPELDQIGAFLDDGASVPLALWLKGVARAGLTTLLARDGVARFSFASDGFLASGRP
jgi:hypothetical protein